MPRTSTRSSGNDGNAASRFLRPVTVACWSTLGLTLSLLALSPAAGGSSPQLNGEVLYFTATWCGACQQMNPIISGLQRKNYPVRKVDVDRERPLAQQYRIEAMPTFILVINGREAERHVGATSQQQLVGMCDKISQVVPQQELAAEAPVLPPIRRNAPARQPAAVKVTPVVESRPAKSFQLPFFGSRREEPVVLSGEPPVVRANNSDQQPLRSEEPAFDPMGSSTRIRVKDKSGVNFGSGTVISSNPGSTRILTCGHIFRQLDEKSTIEVDVFVDGRHDTYLGSVVHFDLEADVGLLMIPTASPLPISQVATADCRVRTQDAVFSIGCGGGEPPTEQRLQVTALNRYLGPDNIECSGIPVQGRSGGGLFNAEGRLIGVCIAADPKEQRGLYAGPKAVRKLLQECGMIDSDEPTVEAAPQFALQEASPPVAQSAPAAPSQPLAPAEDTVTMPFAESPQEEIGTVRPVAGDSPALEARQIAAVQAALAESDEAEVICIVRSLRDPQAASRVVILNRASPKFVSYLMDEVGTQSQRQPASKRVTLPGSENPGIATAPERYRRSEQVR